MYGTGDMLGVAAIVLLASFVTRLSGFGFGLVVVPVLSLFVGPRDAVIVSSLLGLVTTLIQSWVERVSADGPTVRRLFLSACVGMPLGLVVFIAVPEHVLRLVVGVTVIAAAIVLARGFTMAGVSRRAEFALGFASGVLNTSVSTNGPPLVFLLQARRFGPREFRGTISRVFLLSNVVSVSLFVAAGRVTGPAAAAAVLCLPALLLGQAAGARMTDHLDGERFRVLVLVLLVLSGASAVLAAVR